MSKYGSGPSWGNLFDSLISSGQEGLANTGANTVSTVVSVGAAGGEAVQTLSETAEGISSFGDALLITAPSAMFTEMYAHALGDGTDDGGGVSSVIPGISSPEHQQSLFDSADEGVTGTQRLILEGTDHFSEAAIHKVAAQEHLQQATGTGFQTVPGLLFGESGNWLTDPLTQEEVVGLESSIPTLGQTAQAALLLASFGGATGLIRPIVGLVPASFYGAIAGDATLHAIEEAIRQYLGENPGTNANDIIDDVRSANPGKPLWVMKYSDYQANGRKPPAPYTIADPGMVIPDDSPKWGTYEYDIHTGAVPVDMSQDDYDALRSESARKAESGEGTCINLTQKKAELTTSVVRLVDIEALLLTVDDAGIAEDGSVSFSLSMEKQRLTVKVAELEEYIRAVQAGEMEYPACL